MNRAQKVAVWCIAGMLLAMVLLALLLIPLFLFGWHMPLPARIACLTILFAVVFGGFFLTKKKQSKNEVETDEMDIAIQKVAAIITSVSVFVVMGVSLIVANLVWGLNFAVPLWVLMLLFGALVFIAGVVYHIAILIQYGWKGEKQ